MKRDDSITILEKKYDKSVHDIIKLGNKKKLKFEEEMRTYANLFLENNFDMTLKIPIKIDGRLTVTGGSFHFRSSEKMRESVMIKMSERFIACALHDEKDGVEAILDTLRHELVHYAMFEQGRGYKDGDIDFESKLKELGVGSSGATSEDRRLNKSLNIWYEIIDVYKSRTSEKEYHNNHTKKKKSWIGERVSVKIVKSAF